VQPPREARSSLEKLEAQPPREARPSLEKLEVQPTREARPALEALETMPTLHEQSAPSVFGIDADELMRRGNLDLVNALVSDDCVLHDTEAQTLLRGQDGCKEYLTNVRRALPDILVTVHDQEVKGDRVVTRYSVRGTHAGWLRGAPATGRQVSFSGELETRFAHGRVAEQWNSYDVPSIELQLGVTLQRAART
jgi:steroid delta-isomerase-like uncharacterized protein